MSAIYPLTIPKWGIEMQEGTVTEWRFNLGDTVNKGDELIDIESDKIVNTLEAPTSGVLRRIIAEVDETLKVGQLLGVIADAGASDADIDSFIENYVPADASFGIDDEDDDPETDNNANESSQTAERKDANSAHAAPVVDAADVRISPVARRLAKSLQVDITRVKGSGRHGRITTKDIEAFASGEEAVEVAPVQPSSRAAESAKTPAGDESIDSTQSPGEYTLQPLSGRALTAGRRLATSKQDIPHFYLQRDLDLSAALKAKQTADVPLTALLLKALAEALKAHPSVNAHLVEDALRLQNAININVAVDTPDGLVAPLLPAVELLPVKELAGQLSQLAERARNKALTPADLQPGGITLSNLGMFGITEFTAIINPPQVAILALGTLRPRQLAAGSEPVQGMTATLSCDHRAIDGASGARFLTSLQDALNAL